MKRYMIYGLLAAVSIFGISIWVTYVEPKLSFTAPDRIVYNLRNIDRVFPVVTIEGADKETYLPKEKQLGLSELDEGLEEFLERSKTTNFAVFHKGKMVHESYYQGYTRNSTPMSFSTAKSFVSALIGCAIADGKIKSIDDPVQLYEPKLAGSGYGAATIKDVLQMSSGVDFSEEYNDPESDVIAIHDSMYLWFSTIDTVTTSFGAKEKPGKRFHYRSIDTHVLAMVIEAATGKSIQDYISEKLWKPLGIPEGKWVADTHGNAIGFWGLNIPARHYAKLGQLYLQNGKWEGKQIIPEEWVKLSTQPDPEKDFLQRGKIYGDWGYQHQWWLPKGGYNDFSAIGIWGQFIYVSRDYDLVVVKFSADPDFKKHEFEAMGVFRRIGKKLSSMEVSQAE